MFWEGYNYWHARGIHRSTMDSTHKWPVIRSFCVFFVVSLNKLLQKQSSCRWVERQWRSCDVAVWHDHMSACAPLVYLNFFSVTQPVHTYKNIACCTINTAIKNRRNLLVYILKIMNHHHIDKKYQQRYISSEALYGTTIHWLLTLHIPNRYLLTISM